MEEGGEEEGGEGSRGRRLIGASPPIGVHDAIPAQMGSNWKKEKKWGRKSINLRTKRKLKILCNPDLLVGHVSIFKDHESQCRSRIRIKKILTHIFSPRDPIYILHIFLYIFPTTTFFYPSSFFPHPLSFYPSSFLFFRGGGGTRGRWGACLGGALGKTWSEARARRRGGPRLHAGPGRGRADRLRPTRGGGDQVGEGAEGARRAAGRAARGAGPARSEVSPLAPSSPPLAGGGRSSHQCGLSSLFLHLHADPWGGEPDGSGGLGMAEEKAN